MGSAIPDRSLSGVWAAVESIEEAWESANDMIIPKRLFHVG